MPSPGSAQESRRPSAWTSRSSGSSSRCSRSRAARGSCSTSGSGPGRLGAASVVEHLAVPRRGIGAAARGWAVGSRRLRNRPRGGRARARVASGRQLPRPDAPLSYGGIALAAFGAVLLLEGQGAQTRVLAPGAIAGALLLIAGRGSGGSRSSATPSARLAHPQRGARRRRCPRPRLGAADAGADPASRGRAAARRLARAPAGARAARLALRRPAARRRRIARRGALGRRRRHRGAARDPHRARERGRPPPTTRSCSPRARR